MYVQKLKGDRKIKSMESQFHSTCIQCLDYKYMQCQMKPGLNSNSVLKKEIHFIEDLVHMFFLAHFQLSRDRRCNLNDFSEMFTVRSEILQNKEMFQG